MGPALDNRNYPRAKVDFKIQYSLKEAGTFIEAKGHDISATGASFATDKEIASGTPVFVKIHLQAINKVIESRAHVVRYWSKDNKGFTSVQFADIDYHDFITLLDYSLAFNE